MERQLFSTLLILEQAVTVNPERPVLTRVKILGPDSANGRVYLPEAIAAAVQLYEGASINVDHPDKPFAPRGVADRFGWIENVRPEGGCLYGDLHYNPKHALAESVSWWAANAPNKIGLSHNAVGTGRTRPDGVFEVAKIVEVKSVDLVADPATVKGLYESRNGGRMKVNFATHLKRLQERIAAKLSPKKKDRLKRLVEALDADTPAAEMGDTMLDAPDDAESDPHAALTGGFKAAMLAILDDASLDARGKAKKIAKYLKAHEDLTTDDAKASPLDEDDEEGPYGDKGKDEEDETMKEGKKPTAASSNEKALLERIDVLELQAKLRERGELAVKLCEEAKLPQVARTKLFMESLAALATEKAMREAIADRKSVCGIKTPVSSGPVPVTEGQNGQGIDFVKTLTKGVNRR